MGSDSIDCVQSIESDPIEHLAHESGPTSATPRPPTSGACRYGDTVTVTRLELPLAPSLSFTVM